MPYPSHQRICFIVAVSTNHVIGANNDLPWRLRSDLQRFKRLTMGHSMVMGRKTFESLPKVLPGRKSIVLTRQPDFRVDHPDVQVASSVEAIFKNWKQGEPLFVIGGATIFQQFLPLATEVYVTHVLATVDGNVYLPPMDFTDWTMTATEYVPMDDQNQYPSRFEHWQRKHSS